MVLIAGARIPPGAELFRIPDTQRFEVEGRLNAAKAIRVRAGQSVIVEPDALPGLQLTGRVASIAEEAVPGSWPNTDIREFPFAVHFEPESAEQARQKLKHGLTCAIRIDLSDEWWQLAMARKKRGRLQKTQKEKTQKASGTNGTAVVVT